MNTTSINATELGVIDNLMAVNLDVHIWSARKKLTPEDFGGTELPPEELASLGSKKVCDPEALRIFNQLKTRTVSMLDRTGIRFLGGWAIPDSDAAEIVEALEQTRREYLEAKEQFLAGYDDAVQEWIDKHPSWARIIASSTVSADYVRSRLDYRWQIYKVVMPQAQSPAQPNSLVDQGLRSEIQGLGKTLFDETAKAADEAWKNCYVGKSTVTQKALRPLRTIHNKLLGLSFVEPHVSPVLQLMETAFTLMPPKGEIQGADLLMLQGLVSLLRDPASLLQHAGKVMEGHAAEDVLSGLVSAPAAPVFEEERDETPAAISGGLLSSLFAPSAMPTVASIPAPAAAARCEVDSFGLW